MNDYASSALLLIVLLPACGAFLNGLFNFTANTPQSNIQGIAIATDRKTKTNIVRLKPAVFLVA